MDTARGGQIRVHRVLGYYVATVDRREISVSPIRHVARRLFVKCVS